MSIHVTVNSNPLCISRSKVLLTDIELAKKNEWNRRRKLRLQQVRQQARDLASNVRQKCDDEKKLYCKQEYDENEQELKEWQVKQLQKLQKEYDNCIAAIGSGHRTAVCQAEDEESIKQKTELREALAKARGDLARERAKINAVLNKPASVHTKGSPSKRVQQKDERIHTRKPLQKRKIKPKTLVKSPESKPCSPQKNNPITVEVKTNHPTKCTILKPEISRPRQKEIRTVRRQHSCSPPSKSGNLKQVTICADDDSDDSNATWPPRTARVTKTNISPQKVKFYNHDERVCKEYMKPARSVTHLEAHYNEAMEKYVEEEEEAAVKRAEVDAAVQKRSVTRGQKALSKERLEREFKSMARQFSEIDKQQRIARIFEFPYPVTTPKSSHGKDREKSPLHERPFTSKEPGADVYQEMKKCFEIGALAGAKKSPKKQEKSKKQSPVENPFTLKNLIKDLEKERDLLLNSTLEKSPFKDLEQNCEINQESHGQETSRRTKHESLSKVSTFGKNVAVDEVIKNKEISIQKKNYVERDNNEDKIVSDVENSESVSKRSKEKRPHPIEVNVITKPLCDCCEACDCQQKQQETVITGEMQKKENLSPVLKVSVVGKRDGVKHQQPVPFEETKDDLLSQVKSDLEDANVKQKIRSSLDQISSIRVKAKRNSCPETVGPTSSDNGIKITVTVRERNTSENESDVKQISTNREIISESGDNDIPWCARLNDDNDHTHSSSSFCSPPNKLTPAQEAILNSILLKICLKNNNPKLHKYIKRLLLMNKANIDKLAVSSPSEISIHSDIFPDIKMDPITGTYYLGNNKTKAHKKIVFSESKSQTDFTNTGTKNLVKTKKMKKVVQLNTSSEESAHGERSPILKAAGKLDDSLQSNLADEYSFRLQQLIELLNQSPRLGVSELECNESSSSYVYPTLSERLESNSDIAGFECNTALVTVGEEGCTFRDTLNQRNIDISNFEDQGNSSFLRNNITSLGLPFELLPKPFSLDEETTRKEPLPQHKPPVSTYKYRVQGLLPHELSAIPEVSTQISCTEQKILQTKSLKQKNSEFHESEEYDSDVSDVSSICPAAPKTTFQKNIKKKSLLVESVAGPSGLCVPSDTSSISILSHMSNESLIEIGTDISEKDINNFLESPSEYIEEVFSSLGIGWALSTLRKTRKSRQRDSTSTTSTNNENNNNNNNNNNNMIERSLCKSTTKLKGSLGHSHSTPKKTAEPNYSSSSNINEELRRKFKALKNDRLSLTPPDLTLNIPPLGELNNNYNNSNLSNFGHLRHPKCNY